MRYEVPFYRPTYVKNLEKINSKNFNDFVDGALEKLESKINSIVEANYTLGVKSFSSAIHLAMCAIDLKRGDKVICAINSFADVPESIRYFDSEPIFTDIEPDSYHMSIDSLKEVVKKNKSKKLRAIVVSHFAGLELEMSEIKEIAKKNNLIIIEDFSDLPLAKDRVHINGDIALFSLNYKYDNTLKGAMLSFENEIIYNRAKLVREHGIVRANKEVDYLYDIVEIGCDYVLDDLSAYLLDGLIEDRINLVNQKREIVDIYFDELKDLEHIKTPIKSKKHTYSYYIVEVDKNRDAFARELKNRGIEVGLHYIPLNFTTYYKQKYDLKVFSFPNALGMYQKIMSIPCYGKMRKEEALKVVEAIKEVDSIHI